MITLHGDMQGLDLCLLAERVSNWIHAANQQGENVLDQTYERIFAQLVSGSCVVVVSDFGLPAGFLTGYTLGTDANGYTWVEVGSGIVPPEYRGRGYGNMLYKAICQLFRDSVLVGTTKNPIALKCSLQAGFREVLFSTIPPEIRKGLCYAAPCFRPVLFSRRVCSAEKAHGGCCIARVRYPHWSVQY